jgi:hypothetical protein
MLRKDIEENFPFISVVNYGEKEYVGVINNQDHNITSMYVYTQIHTEEQKKEFIGLCESWWWESNRMIPIGIFLRREIAYFKNILMIMNTKDVRIVIGPTVNLYNLAVKRTKRKSVQLVRRPKN